MSTSIKADHRRVQPREDHYKTKDDVRFFTGPYSIEQRQQYIDLQIDLYLTRHPKTHRKTAKAASFQKWRNLVIATIQDEEPKGKTVEKDE